jgi:hypothetical protein
MKENSIFEIIPRGPFTSNGFLHDAFLKDPILLRIVRAINQSYI